MRAVGESLSRTAPLAARCVLPVSGVVMMLREPTGVEDLLLADQGIDDAALVLALAERLARSEPAVDWVQLSVTDIDTLVMRLRQMVVGPRVSATINCSVPGCDSKVEFSFLIDAYLEHQKPALPKNRRGWSVADCTTQPGWYQLQGPRGTKARFRLPALSDQMAVAGTTGAHNVLAARCIEPADSSAGMRARVETVMSKMAPPLAGLLQGSCPDCGAVIAAQFEARAFCLQELRYRARFIYDDIDTLAERYHWSEREILDLPQARRASYAERARSARLA